LATFSGHITSTVRASLCYSIGYQHLLVTGERRAAWGSSCPRCGSASRWWRSRSSASSALWCLLPLAWLVNVSSPIFDMSNVLPPHRVANMVKSTLLWHSTLSRPLPELANFTIKVRSLATRKNNNCANSMRAYAGLYFECLPFKNIWIYFKLNVNEHVNITHFHDFSKTCDSSIFHDFSRFSMTVRTLIKVPASFWPALDVCAHRCADLSCFQPG